MARIADLLSAGRTFSFEFFPPKTDAATIVLEQTIAELAPLSPSFVSITYGAGGTTRSLTHDLVARIRKESSITPMAHLTCVGHLRSEIEEILDQYEAVGVENILALRGDQPADPADHKPTEYEHAIELVSQIVDRGSFSVGVAAHPECHPKSSSRQTDRKHLADKLKLADFAITQFFFDAKHYFQMVEELSALGVDKPVIPGIMPVTNNSQAKRMAELSGAAFPKWLEDRLASSDDADEVRKIGVEAATELCAELLVGGVPGLHFYTMNKSTATREVYANLGLQLL
jgi:methylenetetrahydrofolate reductase (NADPH)